MRRSVFSQFSPFFFFPTNWNNYAPSGEIPRTCLVCRRMDSLFFQREHSPHTTLFPPPPPPPPLQLTAFLRRHFLDDACVFLLLGNTPEVPGPHADDPAFEVRVQLDSPGSVFHNHSRGRVNRFSDEYPPFAFSRTCPPPALPFQKS